MDYKIEYTDTAIINLKEIIERIAEEDPIAALKVGETIFAKIEILQVFPNIGPIHKIFNRHYILSEPYLIFYRIKEESRKVGILRIWHGSQSNPNFWMGRHLQRRQVI